MPLSGVTCRFDPTRGTFDDTPLQVFQRNKVVLDVREYFFLRGDLPYLAFVVEHHLIPPSASDGSSGRLGVPVKPSRPSTDDLRASLPEDRRALFDALRQWRNRTSQDEGVPAYAVLTNDQLLQVCHELPSTRAGLQRISGLGKKKLARYAEDLLAFLAPEESV